MEYIDKEEYFKSNAEILKELIEKIIIYYDNSIKIIFAKPLCYWLNEKLFPPELNQEGGAKKVRENLVRWNDSFLTQAIS